MKVLTTAAPGTQEWLRARAGKIGGSTVADIVCGAMPDVKTYGTPLSAWLKIKTEREALESGAYDDGTYDALTSGESDEQKSDEDRVSPDDYLWWGNASEDIHREILGEFTGYKVTDAPGVLEDAEFPWLIASPDGGLQRESFPDGIAELKAPWSPATIDQWKGANAPLFVQVQLATYFRVWNRDWGVGSAFRPPRRKPKYWEIMRDEAFEDRMMNILVRFWEEHVVADVPPEVTGSEVDYKLMREKLFPTTDGTVIELSEQAREATARRQALMENIKPMEKEAAALRNMIMSELGTAAYGELGNGYAWRFTEEGRQLTKKDIVAELTRLGLTDAVQIINGMEKTGRTLRKVKVKR